MSDLQLVHVIIALVVGTIGLLFALTVIFYGLTSAELRRWRRKL